LYYDYNTYHCTTDYHTKNVGNKFIIFNINDFMLLIEISRYFIGGINTQ
jgi:hypothetical protein